MTFSDPKKTAASCLAIASFVASSRNSFTDQTAGKPFVINSVIIIYVPGVFQQSYRDARNLLVLNNTAIVDIALFW